MGAEASDGGKAPEPIGGEFGKLEYDAWGDPSVTKAYDSGFGPLTRQCIPSVLESLSGLPGPLRVLDVATGPGYVAAAAAEAGHSAVGLDCSEEFLR